MKHNYKKIVAYNNVTNTVSCLRRLPESALFNSRASDEAFYDVYMMADKGVEMIIGISLTGDMYQLSPASYGTYIKEDATTISKFIHKGKLLVAIADYQKKNNIPFD